MRSTITVCFIALALLVTACGGGGGGGPSEAPASPPDTSIDGKPPAATRAASAQFAFSASDAAATFEVSLDGEAFAAATSPKSYSGLAAGTHTFSVRARSAAGGVDATPATFSWAVDLVPPSARIIFPTAVSYTDASSITLRGNANDAHGVQAVTVNGVAATSTDGFQTWRATVPLVIGSNSLAVSVTDAAGNVTNNAAKARVTNRGPVHLYMSGIDYDAATDRIIASDSAMNAIYAYRVTDGIARVLSASPAPADWSHGLFDLAIDTPRNRAIVIEPYLDALIAIDLTTGARSVVSPTGTDAATKLVSQATIALDSVHNRAFLAIPDPISGAGRVVSVDLTNGARSVVSGAGAGSGDAFSRPAGVVYDDVSSPGTPRLLVSEGGAPTFTKPGQITAVDLATGDRTPAIGTLTSPAALKLDAANHRLLVVDRGAGVIAIDLTHGDRTQLGSLTDGGPSLGSTSHLALDVTGNRLFADAYPAGVLAVDLASGRRTTIVSGRVGWGTEMNYPISVALEQASGTAASLLFTDPALAAVVRLDLATGVRTTIADNTVGTGPSLRGANEIVLDTRPSSNGHTALVLVDALAYQLVSLDLTTGNRTPIADLNSSAPAVNFASNMRLDVKGNRVLFVDANYGVNALYAIDLASGARTTISDANRGTGPSPLIAGNITLEPADNPVRALVSDTQAGGIFSVDLATGDRSMLIEPFPIIGSTTWADNVPYGTFLDKDNSRLLTTRVGAVSNLFSIALPSRTQQILSGQDPVAKTTTGAGPHPYGCFTLDVSTTDSVAFMGCPWFSALMAVDLMSGDRVVIAR